MKPSRRQFTFAAGAAMLFRPAAQFLNADDGAGLSGQQIATNTYPWLTFARRAEVPFELHSDKLLAQIAATGITGYEPIIEKVSEFKGLGSRLAKHQLRLQSIYVNVLLHDPELAEQKVNEVVEIAKTAAELGTRIVVANPTPIRWGGTEDKDDTQLRRQAQMFDRLGARLRSHGVTLAYHNHDAELRQGGREFHHMLTATDPDNVKFCFDAHWIFRGCGDSEVAVMDTLTNYHERIVELHLRQSHRGVWTETFTMQGDINYRKLFDYLNGKQIVPHLVLEQAVEDHSPHQLSVVDAHRLSHDQLKRAVNA